LTKSHDEHVDELPGNPSFSSYGDGKFALDLTRLQPTLVASLNAEFTVIDHKLPTISAIPIG
jgi:hypothetical protein